MKIRDLRDGQGWTQSDLGARVGLTQAAVSQHELGRTQPDVDTLRRYAAVFGVSVDEVLGGDPAPGPRQQRDDMAAAIQATAQALDKAAEAMRLAAEAHLILVKRYAEEKTEGE